MCTLRIGVELAVIVPSVHPNALPRNELSSVLISSKWTFRTLVDPAVMVPSVHDLLLSP